MKEAQSRLLALRDDRLPAMPAMLGGDAVELLGAAVAGAGGAALSARPVQITWRPGRSLSVSYDAVIAWSKHQRTTERLVAATGEQLPDGAVILERDEQRVAVWRMTGDPALPGLGIAMDPARVREILAAVAAPDSPASARIRAYRPGRRAVVELNGKGFRLFVKVVPPGEVAALQERHRVIAEHLPVPRSHGWSSEYGLIVLEALSGTTLRECLLDKRQPLPQPDAIAGLLDRIPELPDGRPAPSPVKSLPDHGLLIRSLLPELGDRVDRILNMTTDRCDSFEPVPVHGDLHEAQLLVDGGAVTGLLDIDTAGVGYRIDDWATLLGHLAAWELSALPAARPRIARFARRILEAADAEVGDPLELRRRVAAVVLGMATGPFRAQSSNWPSDTRARVSLAERWLDGAEGAPDKKALMPDSRPSHRLVRS